MILLDIKVFIYIHIYEEDWTKLVEEKVQATVNENSADVGSMNDLMV